MDVTTVDMGADILDVRDLIARFEELDAHGNPDDDEVEECDTLRDLLSDIEGMGGDEQWRGNWYPITLIRGSYFEDYARELADDIGRVTGAEQWPYTCIDWEQAAWELQRDYSSVEVNGITYWLR